MDDVDLRRLRPTAPPRNHAEVPLTIDNAHRRAPSAVQRQRGDRGGPPHRPGRRARPTASTATRCAPATSSCCSPTPRPGPTRPALVRQGQISELIAAKPQNRRRILEEAAGVSGLHTRRHEAELRLQAAETNLERLDDIGRELESSPDPAEARGPPGRDATSCLGRDPRPAGAALLRALDRGHGRPPSGAAEAEPRPIGAAGGDDRPRGRRAPRPRR